MIGWLVSLVVTLAISALSLVPTTVDARLGEALTRDLRAQVDPGAEARVHVEGDPIFQLPWGNVPHVQVVAHGLHAQGFPIHEVELDLDHVHLAPGVVFGHRPPRLLSPADARVAVRISRQDLQTAVETLLSRVKPGELAFDLPLLGHVTPALESPKVTLAGDRLTLTGDVVLKPGAMPRGFEASVGLGVREGYALVITRPSLSIAGMTIPNFLLAGLANRLPPLFDLTTLPLPPGRWQLQAPVVSSEAVELRANGTLSQLVSPAR